ncbi:MAG: phenylacetate--CoA ligase family protein [Candidatus Cloacimonetes bacterium]|nr:phenylacetate--CoA ligase family protein [Candidatus Cloacimonadota bacterium]
MEKSIYQLPFTVLSAYRFLRRSQHWNAAQLEQYQDAQLRALVKHCASHVPYYRELFAQIGFNPANFRGRMDMEKLPLLDKEIVRNHKDQLLADNAADFGITWDSTGGSTGTPLHFALSNRSQAYKIAALLRSFGWAGYRLGNRVCSVQSYYFKKKPWQRVLRYNLLRFDSNQLSPTAIRHFLPELRRFLPRFIMGFPFDIFTIATTAVDEGTPLPRPQAIITYGESLSPQRREDLQNLWQCPIYDFYSLHEGSAMISQCEKGNYHCIDDFAVHEYIQAGDHTELIGTNLYNHTMPLLRYRIRDFVTPTSQPCPCGKPFPVVDNIVGKVCDHILTPDGRLLGSVMSHSMDNAAGVIASQCVQTAIDTVEIRLRTDSNYTQASRLALEAGLRKRLGSKMKLFFYQVDELEKRPSGKTPFIISKIGHTYH